MKFTSIDIKQTYNQKEPDVDFIRLTSYNDKLYLIDSSNKRHEVKEPWLNHIIADDVTDPSTLTPQDYDRYIVPESAINDWSGKDGQIAEYYDSQWYFYEPQTGFVAYNSGIESLVAYNGSIWKPIQSDVLTDNITTKFDYTYALKSAGDDLSSQINKLWVSGNETPLSVSLRPSYSFKNGALFGSRSQDWFITTGSDTITLPAGTYAVYLNRKIPSNKYFCFGDDSSDITPFFSYVGQEDGLYRYETTFTSDTDITSLYFSSQPGFDVIVWLIDRFHPQPQKQLKINNITKIIGADDLSIDGTGMIADDQKHELITRDYVEKKMGLADDVTLESISQNVEYVTPSDIQTLIYDGWFHDVANSGWSLNSHANYDNGIITIPNGTPIPANGEFIIMSNTDDTHVTDKYYYVKMIVETLHPTSIKLRDERFGVSAIKTVQASSNDIIDLGNNEYLINFLIPGDFCIQKVIYGTGAHSTSFDYHFKFVDMSVFPPKYSFKIKNIDYIIDDDGESIDGSDTPMSDAHKELITRAYVDNEIAHLNKGIVTGLLSTVNVDINSAPATIDGVTPDTNERIILVGQDTATEDGVYLYNGENNPLIVDPQYPAGYDLYGYLITVTKGDTAGDTVFMVTNDDTAIIGTDDITIVGIGGESLNYWVKESSPTGFGKQLRSSDPEVKRIQNINNDRGITEMFIGNFNHSDNYTGAGITMSTDENNYTQQLFITMHGDNYYQADLQKRAMIGTDSSLIFSAYNSTDRQGQPAFIDFRVGDDYYNQKSIFTLTTNGLEMPLADKKIWYEAGKTVQEHPSDYTSLFCNVATSEIYAGQPLQAGSVRLITNENITLSGTQNIDGVDTADGDRIAVFSQTDGTENGLYVASDSGAWSRALDFKDGSSVAGTTFAVTEGSLYSDSLWMVSSDKPHDVVGTDEIEVKLIGGSQQVTSSYTVRLLESVFNVDVNNLPQQIDYTDISVGDKICLAAQNDARQNGVYEVISSTQAVRVPELQNGIAVAGFMFVVNEGCLNSDTLWLFSNNKGSDVIGTDNLTLLKVSYDGSIEKTETKIITSLDESNQFIDLQETPLPNYHIQVFYNGQLWTSGDDYDLADDRINFYNHIYESDSLQVFYRYIPGGHCVPPEPPSPSFEFDAVVSDSNDLELKIANIGTSNQIDIDWGDGNTVTYGSSQSNISHTYGDIGTYRVKITGQNALKFSDGTTYSRQITVQHWGDNSAWSDLRGMFQNMEHISLSTDDTLNPTNPIPANDMFRDAVNFNSDIIGSIIFNNLTEINGMFAGTTSFNKDLSSININNGHITSLDYVFQDATSFNQDINSWDVSNITSLKGTFKNTSGFNKPLDTWDTSNVTNMNETFQDNTLFNQDISGWNVSNVTSCTHFRDNASLSCDNTPLLPASCTGCFNKFKFKVTVNSNDSLYFGNIQSKGDTDMIIDWGDGNIDNLGTTYNNNKSHVYNASGTYTVQIHGHKYLKLQGQTYPIEVIHWGDDNAWESLNGMFSSMPNITINTDDNLAPVNSVNANDIFSHCPSFNSDITNWDTTNFTSLINAFYGCTNFNQDLSGWNVSNVTNLQGTFQDCLNFNQDLSSWDISNVTNLQTTFQNCQQFNQPLNNWNTSNVTNMINTFYNCVNFNQPLNNWNTSNVTNMNGMFLQCHKFNQDLNNWDTSKVVNLATTFYGCTDFNGDVTTWNTSNVTTLDRTFYNCVNFNQDLNNWDTSKVTNISRMFENCSKFNGNVNGWDLSQCTSIRQAFRNCVEFNQPLNNWTLGLVEDAKYAFSHCEVFNQDLNNWDTSKLQITNHMFECCYQFNGDITNWDLSSATDMGGMFLECHEFNQPIGNWDVSNATNFNFLFSSCVKFNQPLNNWNTSNVTSMNAIFQNCTEFDQPLDNWDTSKVSTLSNAFSNAQKFNQNINNWNTSSVTDMSSTFKNASQFNQPLNNWDTSNVTTFESMFESASSFNRDLDNWDTSNATLFRRMFYNATSFNGEISSWNTANVTDMTSLFSNTPFNKNINNWDTSSVTTFNHCFSNNTNFNQPLNNWNTSNTTDIGACFMGATLFNQDLNNWDTSNVTNFNNTFNNANQFNGDISNWNTSSGTTFVSMFQNADSFNRDISSWNTSSAQDMTNMFRDNDSFNQDISGWDVSNVVSCSNFKGGTSVLDCSNVPSGLPSTCTGC